MSRIAVPPGIYRIISGNGGAITAPSSGQAALTIVAKSNSSSQQWLISGNGVCTSMNSAGNYAGVSSSSSTVVATSKNTYGWIINAMMDRSGVINGWIMTNDNQKLYWGTTGTNVILVQNPTSWTFEVV